MSFDGKNPFKILRQTWNVGGYEKETLTGNKTLTHSDAQVIGLNCGTGGGRDVILPAPRKGAWFWIFNQSTDADNLAVKQADGSTALATINQTKVAFSSVMQMQQTIRIAVGIYGSYTLQWAKADR